MVNLKLFNVPFLLSVLLFSPQAFSLTAKVYDLKDTNQVLYNYVETPDNQGDRRTDTGVYTSPEGEVVLTDKTEYQNNNLVSYELDHKQVGGQGTIKIEGGKVKFSYTDKGKTKTDEEKLTDNFIIGPTMGPYMHSHWAALMGGATIATRFAVLDRRETIGFDFSKVREFTENGITLVEVKMRPTNFVISAIVDPIYVTFSQDGSKLLSIKGHLLLKRKVAGELKDLIGIIAFQY